MKELPGYLLKPVQRQFSVTLAIRDRFEAAYQEKLKNQKVTTKKAQNPKYDEGFYQANIHRIKSGYVHPYHTAKNPIGFTSIRRFWDNLADLAGPEQVSPHYESLSRSRRIVLVMGAYFATIEMLSLLGGYNDWVRALVFEQKHLFFYMVGMAEIRHFAFLPGPKFTIFYNTFISYELQ